MQSVTPSKPSSMKDSVRKPSSAVESGSRTSTTTHTDSSIPEEDTTSLQRIRSLADFKLYLSPSRRAQIELISEIEPEPLRLRSSILLASSQRKRTLRPAILECSQSISPHTLTTRRRPPLRLTGVPSHLAADYQVRSYSDLLILHHAGELGKLDRVPSELLLRGREKTIPPDPSFRPTAVAAKPPSSTGSPHKSPYEARLCGKVHGDTIPALSRSSNPYYGYPAVRIPDPSNPNHTSIQPQYTRRRKRDLARTLLFLFLLRLQTFRDQVERALGLNRLLPWTGTSGRYVKARDPSEGLLQTAYPDRSKVVKRTWESDWTWMIIGFMLMRGTWTKLLVWPFEVIGLTSARSLLGIA